MHDAFVGLYSVPQTDAGNITTVGLTIQNVFFRLNLLLNLNMFRRQCYNGAGNISGQRTGVTIQDLESRAVSSHFDGHALSLTPSGMLKQCTF